MELKLQSVMKMVHYPGIFLLSLSFLLLSQCQSSLQDPPPGTKRLESGEPVFMDKTPVRNLDYAEYLNWLKEKHGINTDQYKNALPDSALWAKANRKAFKGGKSVAHPETRNLPIVGISYEQAVNYCKWRSQEVSRKLEYRVEYRLPSPAHYKKALKGKSIERKGGIYPVDSDARDFNSLCDNVSEMLAEKDQAISSAKADDCIFIVRYQSPQEKLGFRCVAEIKKKGAD